MSQPAVRNALNWFEIPVRDLDRAQAFYERLLGISMRREAMGPHLMAMFPYGEGAVGGCLVAGAGFAPSTEGALVYLDAGASLDATLARVPSVGGRVTTPRVDLPDGMGAFAHVTDTEGNRFGLHAFA
jgi:predicted enzyme related to lactoylglutathione lyase